MKWLTLAGVLLYLTRHSEAGALKCNPQSRDPACGSEKRDIYPAERLTEQEIETDIADVECLVGSEWESNCHKCRCSESGIAECLKQDICGDQVLDEPIKCKPYSSFRRDCNTCTCLENGLGICTLRGCLHFERRKRQVQCEPGSSWKSDCNTCRCLASGEPACTKRGCLPPSSKLQQIDTPKPAPKPTHAIAKRGVCKPNQEFQVDCNPCKCAANGQSYTCTQNECLEGDNTNQEVEVFMESEGTDHIERHSVCKPRDTFYVGCNICHCNPYGTDYSCTNKPCPLPEDVELFHEPKKTTTPSSNITKRVVCVANRMFIKDCNTCWCNGDGTSFFCTRKVCLPDSGDENSTEDPDFENSTLARQIRAAQGAPKTCQPGQEFRMDCNKCLCNDEGQDFSCTRIDCAAVNGNGAGVDSLRTKRDTAAQVETKCVPESVFDRDCNVCRCTADGLHATCTLKRCKHEKQEAETEATPSFRCTPGDQFKRDCNDCTCSADGKNVFCTLRLCDQDQVLADM